MTKKILVAMILAFTFVIACKAEATEVYVGAYSDGTPVYLLTHKISILSHSPYRFACIVRADGDYLNYSFYPYNGSPYYRNSDGYSGYVFGGSSPVAASIYRYVTNNY